MLGSHIEQSDIGKVFSQPFSFLPFLQHLRLLMALHFPPTSLKILSLFSCLLWTPTPASFPTFSSSLKAARQWQWEPYSRQYLSRAETLECCAISLVMLKVTHAKGTERETLLRVSHLSHLHLCIYLSLSLLHHLLDICTLDKVLSLFMSSLKK